MNRARARLLPPTDEVAYTQCRPMRAPRYALWLIVAIIALHASAEAQERPLVFGVLNQQSPALTAERWNPILSYVSAVSGVPIQLRMGPTVDATDAMMGRGEMDFVFTNHNFQPEFDSVGYKVIARWAGEPIKGVIAVPVDSAVKVLKDLEGARVAFPSRDAFVAYAVPVTERRFNLLDQHGAARRHARSARFS
jgi:ABC-type phosphate/phosphonate transport system substrate-binding protein